MFLISFKLMLYFYQLSNLQPPVRSLYMMLDIETQKIVNEAKRFTSWIFGLGALLAILGVLITASVVYSLLKQTSLIETSNWLAPSMVIAILIEIAFIVFSIFLARTGSASFSRNAAIIGMIILTTSIWFDVLATILASPNLDREGNPFIMMAQESHVPIWGIYLLGFLAQLGITIISCALWLGFLRHHKIYLKVLWAMNPQNLFQFIWVAFGGNLKSTKSHPKRETFSRSYRAIWVIVLCLIQPFSRWVFGLEWLGFPIRGWLVPYIGMVAVFLGEIIMALVAFIVLGWLTYQYYSQKKFMLTNSIKDWIEN